MTEIQSELYKKLKDPEQRARYEHWSRVLLLGFEEYIERSYFAPRGGGRLLIAGEDYQQRRWRKQDEPGIDAGLTRILYRDLPSLLGYKPVDSIEHAVEWPGHLEGADALVPLKVAKGWSLSSAEITSRDGAFRSEFRRRLRINPGNRFTEAHQTLVSAASEPALEASRPSSPLFSPLLESLNGFERVPQKPVALSEIPGMTPGLIRAYMDALRFVPSFLFEAVLDPATTLISRWAARPDPEIEAVQEAGSGVIGARSVHELVAQRHPRLNLAPAESADARSVGYKGGGAQSDAAAGYETKYTLQTPADGTRLPVYRALDLDGKPPRTGSHRYWGGHSRSDAEIELHNHAALHQLMLAVDGGPAAAAIPYDVGIPESLPVWTRDGARRVDQKKYRDDYLDGAAEELAVFRAVTRADQRVAHGVRALSSWAGIRGYLKAVYAAWGEALILPETAGESPDTVADAMSYLRRVHLENRAAAERIVGAIEAKTLRTIAAVHGAGGHLGGMSIELVGDGLDDVQYLETPIGAPQGGAPDMRNMTIAGEMLDLDRSVYFPWAPRPDLDGDTRGHHEAALSSMQKSDLLYWEASMYWMRNMLRGRSLKPGHELLQYPFGNPQDGGIYTVSLGYDLEAEDALHLVRRARPGERPFLEAAHDEIYSEYFAKGLAFRQAGRAAR